MKFLIATYAILVLGFILAVVRATVRKEEDPFKKFDRENPYGKSK